MVPTPISSSSSWVPPISNSECTAVVFLFRGFSYRKTPKKHGKGNWLPQCTPQRPPQYPLPTSSALREPISFCHMGFPKEKRIKTVGKKERDRSALQFRT